MAIRDHGYRPVAVRVHPLRTFDLPDLGDHVIHFTGRSGERMAVPDDIRALDAPGRLAQILHEKTIRAVATFGTGGRPIVALTESSQASVRRLIRDGRYQPWGIGFSKQFVFSKGGGPVLYVRGDEWDAACDALPDPVRARLVRYWPGAVWEPGDPVTFEGAPCLPDALAKSSEWIHEREWRVPADLKFGWGDVRFMLVPSTDWPRRVGGLYRNYGAEYEEHFTRIPVVAIDPQGNLLYDGSGIWNPLP